MNTIANTHAAVSQGNERQLSKKEYALLLAFLGAPQRPLTRAYPLQATQIRKAPSIAVSAPRPYISGLNNLETLTQ